MRSKSKDKMSQPAELARREVATVTAAHLLAATEQFIITDIERRARASLR